MGGAKPESDLNPEQIRMVCRVRLHGWKGPKEIIFTEEIPKNTMGNIQKEEV